MQDNTPISWGWFAFFLLLAYLAGHFRVIEYLPSIQIQPRPIQQTAPVKPNCVPNGNGGYICQPAQ